MIPLVCFVKRKTILFISWYILPYRSRSQTTSHQSTLVVATSAVCCCLLLYVFYWKFISSVCFWCDKIMLSLAFLLFTSGSMVFLKEMKKKICNYFIIVCPCLKIEVLRFSLLKQNVHKKSLNHMQIFKNFLFSRVVLRFFCKPKTA